MTDQIEVGNREWVFASNIDAPVSTLSLRNIYNPITQTRNEQAEDTVPGSTGQVATA